MISPVLEEYATTKEAYFPDQRWYDISKWVKDGTISEMEVRGAWATLGRSVKNAC